MNIKKIIFAAVVAALLSMGGCTVKYSLSGASIPPDAKTVSIAYFPNNAAMVSTILSSTFTEALQDKFSRQTKLDILREDGDLDFQGEITNYTTTPTSISANEYALQNRLTITVMVRFTNRLDPSQSFNRSFSSFSEYDASQMLSAVEGQLIPEIVEMLVDDIFNAAVANW